MLYCAEDLEYDALNQLTHWLVKETVVWLDDEVHSFNVDFIVLHNIVKLISARWAEDGVDAVSDVRCYIKIAVAHVLEIWIRLLPDGELEVQLR